MSYLMDIPIEIYKKILLELDPNSLININKINFYTRTICDNNFFYEYITKTYDSNSFGLVNWTNIFNSSIINDNIISKFTTDKGIINDYPINSSMHTFIEKYGIINSYTLREFITDKEILNEYIISTFITDNGTINTWKGIFNRLNNKRTIPFKICAIKVVDEFDSEIIKTINTNLDIYFMDTYLTILERLEKILYDNFIDPSHYKFRLHLKGGGQIECGSYFKHNIYGERLLLEPRINYGRHWVYININNLIGTTNIDCYDICYDIWEDGSLFDSIDFIRISYPEANNEKLPSETNNNVDDESLSETNNNVDDELLSETNNNDDELPSETNNNVNDELLSSLTESYKNVYSDNIKDKSLFSSIKSCKLSHYFNPKKFFNF